MDYNKYLRELGKIPGSRLNVIVRAVNSKLPKDQIELNSEVEDMFFDRLMKEANAHVKKYGDWPVFDMFEIESDDPILDIYKDPVEPRKKG